VKILRFSQFARAMVGVLARSGCRAICGHGIPETTERILENSNRIIESEQHGLLHFPFSSCII
jgi:hypothetical protein